MLRFAYKAYRRPLAGDFSNARERLAKREGLLIRLEDAEGRVGFGEAAPLPSFGTEAFVLALAVAEGIGGSFEWEKLNPQLGSTPALRWGIESALASIARDGAYPKSDDPWPISYLMPDLGATSRFEERLAMHYRCFKFKIGKRGFLEERKALEELVERSEGRARFRLDANASLGIRDTVAWMECIAELPVEFLEQPMQKGMEPELIRLCEDFPTPIALDESVCSIDDLKRWRDEQWPGIFVIKPSLSGSLEQLQQEISAGACDCVFSSALETKVGASSAIAVALAHRGERRALGFGVDDLFADRNVGLELGPFLQTDSLPSSEELESLWNRI